MSYTVEVKKNRGVSYSCSNMSWHIMWDEIEEAVSEQYKPAIQKIQDASHEGKTIRWETCRKIAAALETIPQGAGHFSAPCTIEALLVVFRTAVEMKSSVYIW